MGTGRTLAVIDVGSNSVRLLVARELSTSAFEVVDEGRFDARLGEGQAGGDLTPEGMERGLRALRVMVQIARSHGPARLVIAGTEALRRAPNADLFLAAAYEQTGETVRILSGTEEAYAGFLGVANSTTLASGCVLDVGGGSLELMRVAERRLVETQSAPLGAIYARERYFRSDPPAPRDVRALRKAVRQQLGHVERMESLYATGGAVRSLARLIRSRQRYPMRRIHGFVIEGRRLHRLANELTRATPEQRRQVPGLNANRLETLPAAAVVIDEVMDLVGANALVVAGQGLREGLIWQEMRPGAHVIGDVRGASIAGLARANNVDELAAEPIVAAAAALFEATAPVHGYGDTELELLLSAARLAGIGMHVDYYNRDRHGEYLVHSGDLRGFSHREIVLLAALVRWSASGTPDLSEYKGIAAADDGRRAHVLAVLLGLARALRRRSPSPLFDVRAELRDGTLCLRLRAGGSLDAELHEIEGQQRRLESILKLSLELEVSYPG